VHRNRNRAGRIAYKKASDAVRSVFGTGRKRAGLTYDVAVKGTLRKERQQREGGQGAGIFRPAQTRDGRGSRRSAFPSRATGPVKARRIRMIWYAEDIKRFKREREALELLGPRENWLTPLKWRIDDSSRVVWDADISVRRGTDRYP
jgi:hypothetical protein